MKNKDMDFDELRWLKEGMEAALLAIERGDAKRLVFELENRVAHAEGVIYKLRQAGYQPGFMGS